MKRLENKICILNKTICRLAKFSLLITKSMFCLIWVYNFIHVDITIKNVGAAFKWKMLFQHCEYEGYLFKHFFVRFQQRLWIFVVLVLSKLSFKPMFYLLKNCVGFIIVSNNFQVCFLYFYLLISTHINETI